MLIAEELLLLLTDVESGAPLADRTSLTYALAGANLLELSLAGKVDVAGPADSVKKGRLVVRDRSPTDDQLLDHALGVLAERGNKRPRDVIRHLAKGVRTDVYTRLAERGLVRRVDSKVLGLFPRTRWPIADPAQRERLRYPVEQLVLGQGSQADPHVSALVSLLAAIDKLPRVVPPENVGLSKRQIRQRGKEISADSWAPQAVKDAVAAVNAAMTGAIVAGAVVGGSSS